MILKKLLNAIQSKHVIIAGYIYALIAAAFCLSGHTRILWLVLVLLAGLNWVLPITFLRLANWVDPQFWPTFVLLSTAVMVAAPQSRIALGSVFMIFDGMYFPQNY